MWIWISIIFFVVTSGGRSPGRRTRRRRATWARRGRPSWRPPAAGRPASGWGRGGPAPRRTPRAGRTPPRRTPGSARTAPGPRRARTRPPACAAPPRCTAPPAAAAADAAVEQLAPTAADHAAGQAGWSPALHEETRSSTSSAEQQIRGDAISDCRLFISSWVVFFCTSASCEFIVKQQQHMALNYLFRDASDLANVLGRLWLIFREVLIDRPATARDRIVTWQDELFGCIDEGGLLLVGAGTQAISSQG